MAARDRTVDVSVRDQAFLALLLLVGSGAIGVGLFELVRTGGASLSAVLDLSLGAAVLLVTWLFLAPLAIPEFFGDRRAAGASRPSRREALPMASARPASAGSAPPSRPHPRPDPIIPKWADPLVVPRNDASPRPAVAARAALVALEPDEPEAPIVETPPPLRPVVPAPTTAPSRAPSQTLDQFERELRQLLGEPTPPDPDLADPRTLAPSAEILRELDRIEADLRAFVPIEPESVSASGGLGLGRSGVGADQ